MAGESRSVARVVAALVVTTWLVGVAPVLLGGRTFGAEPHVASTLPWFDRLADAVADGHLPEWDDASGLGAAVALEGGRPLCYPPAWVVAALPRPWGTDVLLLGHLLLFGLGAAAWARRLGADPLGAVVAGGGASLSVAATGALTAGAALCAAAWLPWVGWAADRLAALGRGDPPGALAARALALAAVVAALLLAAGGATGAALAAPAVAGAAIAGRAPWAARAWLGLLAACAAGLLLSAAAWVPAALAGALRLPFAADAPGLDVEPAEILAVVLALAGAVAGAGVARRIAVAAIGLAALAALAPASGDGFPAAFAAVVFPLAGLGATAAARALARVERLRRVGPALVALLATATIGPLAGRAWRLPLVERDLVAEPPALLAGALEDAADAGTPVHLAPDTVGRPEGGPKSPKGREAIDPASRDPSSSRSRGQGGPGPRRRIAWPAHGERGYRDAPPETGARFGFAYVPGRDRARDPELAALWRASSGAGKRLLDLFDVEYAVVPATVATPAGMTIVGTSSSGERVLVESDARRPRAFVAPRWSWHADAEALRRALFPLAPDQRGSLSFGEVRLLGAGTPPPGPARGLRPAPACAIESTRPERVRLVCRSGAGGYAVLLDRAAPGWSARVDGDEAAIVTADLLVRAVAMPPGLHRIDFEYRTPGLRLGAILSGAAWLNALALALLLRRLRNAATRA